MFHEDDISPDHLEGFSHWVSRKGGYPLPAGQEHPFARALDRRADTPDGLSDILRLLGMRSIGTGDVAALYGAAARTLVERAYQNIAGTVDPIVRNIVAKDFKPVELGQIDVANEPATADQFFGAQDIKYSTIEWSESVITGQVKTYGFHVPINDRLFANGEFDLIGQMIAAAAGKLGQLPVRKLADILNANPSINGVPLIAADNSLTDGSDGGAPGPLGLEKAINALEREHHVPAAFLLCAPNRKAEMAELLNTMPALNIALISNPWLTSTAYCYLLPDPLAKPVFAKLAFTHPLVPGIRKQRLPEDAAFWGQVFCIDLEFDLIPISRAIVRIGG